MTKSSVLLNRFGLGYARGITPLHFDLTKDLSALFLEENHKINNDKLQATAFYGRDIVVKGRVIDELRKNTASPQEMNSAVLNAPSETASKTFSEELTFKMNRALKTPFGFVERWTMFWSNHFCVSADKGAILRVMTGSYEREAILPHLFGSFEDMLYASIRHPAMLIYLDNTGSIGPNSNAGKQNSRGLNENLAREILELHTLGVNGGYSQNDVRELAKLITGWSITSAQQLIADVNLPYGYLFSLFRHERGIKILLKENFAEGENEGIRALKMLAHHPQTAKHIAVKLIKHFVSEKPIPSLEKKLTENFIKSKGNLKSLAETLLNAPESHALVLGKIKRPQEWLISVMRAINYQGNPNTAQSYANLLGQPFWRPLSPKGHSDANSQWLNGLHNRFDVASLLAKTVKISDTQIMPYIEEMFQNTLSDETKLIISRAESAHQALTIAFLSPEMLRR